MARANILGKPQTLLESQPLVQGLSYQQRTNEYVKNCCTSS